MGYATALAFAKSDLPLETQVSAHFASNTFPPIPQACVPAAVEAIEAMREGDDGAMIELPVGVEHRVYGSQVPADVVVDGWRLEAWI